MPKTTPIGPCTHCGTQTDGLYSVHKFAFGVGPEVPLCEPCLNGVDLRDIWQKNIKAERIVGSIPNFDPNTGKVQSINSDIFECSVCKDWKVVNYLPEGSNVPDVKDCPFCEK